MLILHIYSWIIRRWFSHKLEKYLVLEGEDSDVTRERQKIASSSNDVLKVKQVIMKILNLTKVFRTGLIRRKTKVAVKSISVGIKKGEVSTTKTIG